MDDAIYNFSRVYQQYALQGDASDEDEGTQLANKISGNSSLSTSDDDHRGRLGSGSSKNRVSPKQKKKGFEKVTLLVGSDEEEIF